MIDVKGKWALVTGASRGVGYQIATFMAKQGCNVILHSRNLEHNKKVEEAVQSEGVEFYSLQAELANHEEVEAMLDQIEDKGTPVDIVFNNAAVQIAYREEFWKTPVEDYDQSFKINFISVATICQRLMPKMIERGFGRVVNVTSGIRDQPEQSAYAASKAALDKYTKDLSARLDGTNVVISLTDPNWCKTDLGGQQAPNEVETVVPGIVVGAFVESQTSGRFFHVSNFYDLSLEDAVAKAETVEPTPYTI